MGQSRTIGAVKSFFSKNRRRLELDRIAEGAAAAAAATAAVSGDAGDAHAQQVRLSK